MRVTWQDKCNDRVNENLQWLHMIDNLHVPENGMGTLQPIWRAVVLDGSQENAQFSIKLLRRGHVCSHAVERVLGRKTS